MVNGLLGQHSIFRDEAFGQQRPLDARLTMQDAAQTRICNAPGTTVASSGSGPIRSPSA
jgi:hypothetical protein